MSEKPPSADYLARTECTHYPKLYVENMCEACINDVIAASRREGARDAIEKAAQTVENPLALLLPPKDVAAAIRALADGEESDGR